MKLLPLILSSLFITTLAQARERPLARRNTPSKRVTRHTYDSIPESNPAPLKQDTSPAPSPSDIWDIFQRVNPPPPSFVQNPSYDPQQKQSPHQAQNWYNPLAAIVKRQASTDPTTECGATTVTPPGFDGSCTAAQPCPNGACCGSNGFCGYGSEYCGDRTGTDGVCLSNCDALAECGPNAAAGEESCALNVCCSKFGFCGSTDEFCVDECADDPSGHCGKVSVPTNAGASVLSRVIGYYESWAATRPCSAWFPQNVPADGYTHLNFAFAGIDPDSSQIVPGDTNDPSYYSSFTGLKKINLNLKTYISVGGWAFNDPPTQRVFSTVAGDVGKSQTFANSAVAFMIQYGFDGVDIDWEYPVACERGGAPEDFANFPRFLSILRQTFDASGHTFGLTFTAPSSYWYLQHFDLQNLLKYADWINLMSYDLHGTWDAKDAYIGNIVGAHTNLTEIDQSLQLFMRAGVPLNKIVLGLGFYGRSFELSDANCAAPGCPFNGPAAAGPCTASAGILSYSEIQDVITRTKPANIVHDQTAAVKYFEFNDGINVNQWVSYDDADTFKQKIDYANGGGLGGVMVWAADQDDFAGSALSAILGQPVGTAIPAPDGFGSNDAQSCTVMDCGVACPSGFVQMTDVTTGDLADPHSGCKTGGRAICCPAGNQPQDCQWRGTAPLCNVGEISLAGDSWGTGKKCGSGHKQFCCKSGLTDAQLQSIQPSDCKWCSRSDNCNDNTCPTNTVVMGQSYWGDWKQEWYDIFGTGACPVNERQLCCTLPGGNAVTAPFTLDELFDSPPEDEDMSYKLQTETINDDNPDAGSDNPETTPFGLVVIDGPDHYVSDLTRRSNWELIGCHPTEETQSVRAVCTKGQNDAGCNHVFIRAAEDTIVKMPKNCGPGPYARVVSLIPSKTARLSKRIQQLDESIRPIVYDLTFDYKFHEIRAPADMEPALMRIDVTNIPGYWDEIVTGTTRRRDLMNDPQMIKRGLEERWFGAFGDWLAKTTQVKSDTSARLGMQQAFSTTLFSASQNCASEDGSTQFASSLNVAVHGNAQAHVTFGLYVQGHVLPSPSIDAAYVYVVSQATANLGFEVTGKASVTYDPGQVKMIPEIAWPGLSVPGLATIGPTFNIYGTITGSLSLSGTFSLTSNWDTGEFYYSVGTGDQHQEAAQSDPGFGTGWQVTPHADVQLNGNLAVHVIPTASLGINILNGLVNAQANLALDGSVYVDLSASLTGAHVAVGDVVRLDASVTGTGFSYPGYNFFNLQHEWYSADVTFGTTKRDYVPTLAVDDLVSDGLYGALPYSYAMNGSIPRRSQEKRGLLDAFGFLKCPTVEEGGGSGDDCFNALLDGEDLSDTDVNEERRRDVDDSHLQSRTTVAKCAGLTIVRPEYSGAPVDGFYDLSNPQNPTSFTATSYTTAQLTTARAYAYEHVYENQLFTMFISDVIVPFFASLYGGNGCAATKQYIFQQWGGRTIANDLQATMPNRIDEFPKLNQVANTAKAAFISGKSFKTADNLAGKSATQIVYYLRQAALSIYYLRDQDIREYFDANSNLVRDIWTDFMGNFKMSQIPPVSQNPILVNFDVGSEYDLWIQSVVLGNYRSNALTFINYALPVLQTKFNGAATITINTPLACDAHTETITYQQMANAFASANIPDIDWT